MVYILHSSTDYKSLVDIFADAGLAVNKLTKRVKQPIKLQLQVEDKYLPETSKIITVGYSLGAAIAEQASKKSRSAETFIISRPITFLNVRSLLDKKVTSIKSKIDPVGLLSLLIKSGSKEMILHPGKIKNISDFFREHLYKTVLGKLEDKGITDVGLVEDEIEEVKAIGSALPLEAVVGAVAEKVITAKVKNLKVAELKMKVKKLRKEKKQKVADYPVYRVSKANLILMIKELEDM